VTEQDSSPTGSPKRSTTRPRRSGAPPGPLGRDLRPGTPSPRHLPTTPPSSRSFPRTSARPRRSPPNRPEPSRPGTVLNRTSPPTSSRTPPVLGRRDTTRDQSTHIDLHMRASRRDLTDRGRHQRELHPGGSHPTRTSPTRTSPTRLHQHEPLGTDSPSGSHRRVPLRRGSHQRVFSYADLTNAFLESTSSPPPNAFLHSTKLTNAFLSGRMLSGADLTGADLLGTNLTDALYSPSTIVTMSQSTATHWRVGVRGSNPQLTAGESPSQVDGTGLPGSRKQAEYRSRSHSRLSPSFFKPARVPHLRPRCRSP